MMKTSASIAISLSAGSLALTVVWFILSKFNYDEEVLFYIFFLIPLVSLVGICYPCKRFIINKESQPALVAGGVVSLMVFCSFWTYLVYEFFRSRTH